MTQKDRLVRVIETDEAILGLRDDGIVHVFYKAHSELDVPLQIKLVNLYDELTDGKKARFIFQADEYCTITKEARDNAVNLESRSAVRASAIIVQNVAYKLIADFYLKFNKPKSPYKVFSDFDQAVAWLKTIRIEEE